MTLIAVDTNVILRFLTGDPAVMAEKSRKLFSAVDQGEVALYIDEIVFAEVVWVLKSYYGYPHKKIAIPLQELISHPGLKCENKERLLLALLVFAEMKVDFADALLATRMKEHEIKQVYSFDTHFDHISGIEQRIPGE
jgi:predicted nucleic acid-binding protein